MKPDPTTIHPELRGFAGMIPQITASPKMLRIIRLLERFSGLQKKPADISIENTFIAGPAGQLRLRVYRPVCPSSPAPLLLWLHGGGYVIGKPEQDDGYCAQYVRELGLVVASVDYRVAPEHPFPAGLEDAYAALSWVNANAEQLGVDAARIAIGGGSAGGGLAAALVQLAVDCREILPVFQLLVYPMLDDRTTLRSDLENRGYLSWDPQSNRFGWEAYLGQACGSENVPPYAVPARREDLTGLPPAWIGVGTIDLFHDEDVAYGQRLRACGVPCETCVIPGGFHGFDYAGQQYQVVREFRTAQVEALKRSLF